jgi:hypothetical protein
MVATRWRSSARDSLALASRGLSNLLALEIEAPTRASRSIDRDPAIDPRDQHRMQSDAASLPPLRYPADIRWVVMRCSSSHSYFVLWMSGFR